MAHHIFYNFEYYQANNHCREKPLEGLGAGDSSLFFDVLDKEEEGTIFQKLEKEINWFSPKFDKQKPFAIQGEINAHKNSKNIREPLYRHPSTSNPKLENFTQNILQIRNKIHSNILLNQDYYNHAIILYYRGGTDSISPHTDKTLDLKINSKIIIYSVGSARILILRSKNPIEGTKNEYYIQKMYLPHNSAFVLGWNTNKLWTHAIKQDKRNFNELNEYEIKEDRKRISVCFRSVPTFVRHSDGLIYGQGSRYKTEEELDSNFQALTDEEKQNQSKAIGDAFRIENKSVDFNWDTHYSNGFDVVQTYVKK